MNENLTDARKSFQDKKFRSALNLFREEISEHPENLDAYIGASRCLFMLKRPSEAIEMAERIIILDTKNVMAHVIKAEAYESMKEVQKSKSEIEFAYSMEPTNPNVLGSYGYLLIRTGKWNEGITFFRKALEQDPGMVYVHLNLAVAYQKIGNSEQALYYTGKVNELRPSLKNRIRLTYARLNRIGLLKPLIYCVIILFIVSAILHEFVLFSIVGLILLLLFYFRVIFQTP